MKTKLIILLILLANFSKAKQSGTNIIIHVSNLNTPYMASIISTPMMNTIYFDTIGKSYDSIFIQFKEPSFVFFVINNDVNRLFSFWLDVKGKNELFINAADVLNNSSVYSKYNELYKKYCSDRNNLFVTSKSYAFINEQLKSSTDSSDLNGLLFSQSKLLDSINYEFAIKNKKSYFTLWNLHHWIEEYKQANSKSNFTKEQLCSLFKKIPKKMKKYPSYIKSKQMLDYKQSSKIFINEPLLNNK